MKIIAQPEDHVCKIPAGICNQDGKTGYKCDNCNTTAFLHDHEVIPWALAHAQASGHSTEAKGKGT